MAPENSMFDIAYIGHYTKDTIIYPDVTRVVDGGAFFYGSNVIARMGLRGAVITNLARQDWHVVQELEEMGTAVFARATTQSTCLSLVYATRNLDERTIHITSQADPFSIDQVEDVQARAFIVGASVRGEVPVAVVQALADKGAILALDVQGFLRIVQNGTLIFDGWKDRLSVLKHVTILKTDAVEAEHLTGEQDHLKAMHRLAEYGPREILLTYSGGVSVLHDGNLYRAPLVPRELRGRSGRGDTCTASYVSRRLTAPPADSVIWAAAVTSLKLETEGPFRRTLAEAQALYDQLKDSTSD